MRRMLAWGSLLLAGGSAISTLAVAGTGFGTVPTTMWCATDTTARRMMMSMDSVIVSCE